MNWEVYGVVTRQKARIFQGNNNWIIQWRSSTCPDVPHRFAVRVRRAVWHQQGGPGKDMGSDLTMTSIQVPAASVLPFPRCKVGIITLSTEQCVQCLVTAVVAAVIFLILAVRSQPLILCRAGARSLRPTAILTTTLLTSSHPLDDFVHFCRRVKRFPFNVFGF